MKITPDCSIRKCFRALDSSLQKFWYKPLPQGLYFLRAWNLLFFIVLFLKKKTEALFIKPTDTALVPVVVVGNVTVGGTGKTPLIIALAHLLVSSGLKPGIVASGYRGAYRQHQKVRVLDQASTVEEMGDEAILMYNATRSIGCQIAVSKKRNSAASVLCAQYPDIDVILSDDGLQQTTLKRHCEIVLLDGLRGFGNGLCLPFGPLREPLSSMDQRIVGIKSPNAQGLQGFDLEIELLTDLSAYVGQTVHAIAGIANPESFFTFLESMHIHLIKHPFPDHYEFKASDLTFLQKQPYPCLTTEKDMVKLVNVQSAYPAIHFVPVGIKMKPPDKLVACILKMLGKA